MRLFGRDFTSDVIANSSRLALAKAIHEHEKTASHTPSGFDESLATVLATPNVLLKRYPRFTLSQDSKSETEKNAQILSLMNRWFLLRSYVDMQIAKLFKRVFDELLDASENAQSHNFLDARLLYIPDMLESNYSKDDLEQPLENFSQLGFTETNNRDERMKMLLDLLHVDYKPKLEVASFIFLQGRKYNLEYVKCIIMSIMFDALRYGESFQSDFIASLQQWMSKKDKENFNLRIYREKMDSAELMYN